MIPPALRPGLMVAVFHLHLHLPIHLHLHLHRFHGSPVQYSALAVGAAASFFGIPGPGEPLLVAAGILAARHQLDLVEVIVVAFGGALFGGMFGWILGRLGGRALLTRPGPLLRLRMGGLERGEDLFRRHPVFAIVLTPPWVAGISDVRRRTFLTVNAAAAFVWAAGIGGASYAAGPVVVDWVNDVGTILGIAVVVLVVVVVVETRRRGRRRRAARA